MSLWKWKEIQEVSFTKRYTVAMEQKKEIKRIAEQLNEELSKSLENFTNKPISKEDFELSMFGILKELLEDTHDSPNIKFDVEESEGTEMIMKPHNLFTALLLKGFYVPYEEIGEKSEYEHKILGQCSLRDKTLFITPNKPVEYINISLNMERLK